MKSAHKSKSILVVEDESIMRESLRDWLTEAGYNVDTAEEGEKALRAIAERDFGLLILDLKLPGAGGIDLLRQAKAKRPQLKGIIITAYPSVQTAVEAMKEGAIDYLTKPFDLNQLEEIIRETLGPVQIEIKPTREMSDEEVTLTIDGIKVKARQGMTILQAARSVGIDIPTLCYHEKLTPSGACRLCTVEIVKGQRSRLVTSCTYPVEPRLVVRTESKSVVNVRKMLLSMMWSRAPGVQAIRDLCIKYGVDMKRSEVKPTYCILCGLCVRYCSEVKKKNLIGFVGQGTERQVMFLPGVDFKECSSCGECYGICPTGLMPSNYGC